MLVSRFRKPAYEALKLHGLNRSITVVDFSAGTEAETSCSPLTRIRNPDPNFEISLDPGEEESERDIS
jgi:hypothetical protein